MCQFTDRIKKIVPIMLSTVLFCGCGNTAAEQPETQEETAEAETVTAEDTAETETVTAEDTAETETVTADNTADTETEETETEPEFEVPETPVVDENGFSALFVSGTSLVDTYGEPVQLKGVSTHGINWYGDYVNQTLFDELKNDWNADLVRLALYTEDYDGYCTEDADKEALMQTMKNGVDYATAAGLYVIVDWHMGSTDWSPLQHTDEAVEFFDEISSEYADSCNVIYEICNEPWDPTEWADIKEYAETVIPVIRNNDPDSLILVGTPHWSQYVTLAGKDPLEFDNCMYVFHFYAATHKNGARDTLTKALESGIPVFVTEFGTCLASGNGDLDLESAEEWIDLMDRNGVSYCIWNLSNKDESSALVKTDCTKTSGFTDDDLTEQGVWYRQVLQRSK